MTEEKKVAKPKTGKVPAVKKETAPKAKQKPVAKDPAQSLRASQDLNKADGKIKVTQIVGSIARRWDQEATLKGLGLNKRHRSKVLENTPSVRGMVYKVRHLITVEKA